MLYSSITMIIGHTKINEQVKKYLYNWVLKHHQVVQSTTSNYCLKLSIDSSSEPQVVPNILLQVSFRELHKNMVSPPE